MVIIFVMRVKNKGILIITSVFVGLIWRVHNFVLLRVTSNCLNITVTFRRLSCSRILFLLDICAM